MADVTFIVYGIFVATISSVFVDYILEIEKCPFFVFVVILKMFVALLFAVAFTAPFLGGL